ncbi:MAG TPA: glycosyltransferase [Candidatus Binataceae bacterium]
MRPVETAAEASIATPVAASEKPRLLMVFYGNPDYYAAICREAAAIGKHFVINLIGLDDGRARAHEWPAGIAVERFQQRASSRNSRIQQLVRLVDYARFIRTVRRRARELNPAVVYTYDTRGFVAGLAAQRAADFALVFHWHDLFDIDQLARFSPQRWIEKQGTARGPRADLVVADDPQRIQHYLSESGDSRPAVLLPNYPSREQFPRPADFDALLERRFGNREILYTGGIGGEGNATGSLIRACAMLPPDCRLTLYGPSPDETLGELRGLAQSLSLGTRVRYGGRIPWSELIARTGEATVGAVTFRPVNFNYSAMGSATNKLYEYAARGLPVVVPDTPSFRAALGGELWAEFVDIDNPASVARGLRGFLDDRDRYASAGRAARRAFEECFNFECVFPRLYQRLAPLAAHTSRDAIAITAQ